MNGGVVKALFKLFLTDEGHEEIKDVVTSIVYGTDDAANWQRKDVAEARKRRDARWNWLGNIGRDEKHRIK
jgi:hypothetical protein